MTQLNQSSIAHKQENWVSNRGSIIIRHHALSSKHSQSTDLTNSRPHGWLRKKEKSDEESKVF